MPYQNLMFALELLLYENPLETSTVSPLGVNIEMFMVGLH